MTQHPFNREFSEQEAAQLNGEQEPIDTEQELTDEDAEQVAGGIIPSSITAGIGEGGGIIPPFPTKGMGEDGGGISSALIEAGIS